MGAFISGLTTFASWWPTGWDDVGSTTLVTRLSNLEPKILSKMNLTCYRKSNFAVAYADHRSFKLKGSPATIGGGNYSFFEVPVVTLFFGCQFICPLSKNFADFSVTAGFELQSLLPACWRNGTDLLTNVYKFR